MNKQLLERFISKYNLGGAAEAVVLTSNNGSLSTKFIGDDKNVLGIVHCDSIDLEDGEYGIFNTAQLRSLLSVLDDDIKIKIVKTKGVPTGVLLSDSSTKVTYVLADKANIPGAPDLKTPPPFEVEIKLDQKFINTFIKAKGALADVELFTLLTDGRSAHIVIGYNESINTNRVSVDVETTKNEAIDPISFSAGYFKEILMANKEMEPGVLKVSSKGLAHVHFDSNSSSPKFEVNYYLVRIERK